MTFEYDSHSDDDEEIVVSKRKRNVVLDDESEDETTSNVLNKTTNSNSNDENDDSSTKDDRANDNSIVESSEIETLPKDKGNESDSDDNSTRNDSVIDDPIGNELLNADEDSNHSEKSSKNSDNEKPKEKKYTFDPSIYDAEESDEENRSKTPEPLVEDERSYDEVQNKHSKSKKSMAKEAKGKSSKQQNKSKSKNPSDNMREIRRESQRMVRESQVTLPYHIPKQRTLAEFLNRKKLAPSIPIRTTAEQLISLSKQIEQQEKESQEFFKSDSSDNDDDSDDKDYVPDNEKNSKSAQDNKMVTIDDDDKTDENFNKEKVTDDSSVEGSAKINENIANLLTDVAERLRNEVGYNSLEDSGKNYESSQPSTKISTDDNDTQLLHKLLIRDSDEQPNSDKNIVQDYSALCKKNSPTKTSVNSTINEVRLETNSTSKDDQSDCEDFTLNLTMPEDGEHVEEHEEKEKEASFTLDLTMPEDSVNVVEDKETGNEESSSLNLTMHEDSVKILGDEEKGNEESSSLNLTMPEDSANIVGDEKENADSVNLKMSSVDILGDEEKSIEESLSLNLTMPEDSVNIVGDENDDLVSRENKFSKLKKIELLSKIHIDLTEVPTLTKSFGGEINFDSPPKNAAGIIDLRERFFKHFAMDKKSKKKSKSPVKVSVVRASVDDKGHVEGISTETIISGTCKPDEQWLDEIKEAELPGAKHSKLKAFLESKAKEKWKIDYEKRIKEHKLNEEETLENDKADYEHEAILDDEDEEEDMTNSEEEEEEEPEENDVELVDKKRRQSKFVEEEADVSEDEEECGDDDDDNGGKEEEEVVEENEDDLLGYNESDGEDEDSERREGRKKKKTKKRKTTSDEEDDSENEEVSDSVSAAKRKRTLMTSDCDDDDDYDHDDDDDKSPKRNTKLMSSDSEQASQSMEDLAGLCSGRFPTQPVSFSQLETADADNLLKGFADSKNSQSQNIDSQLQSRDRGDSEEEEEDEEEEGDCTRRMKKSILDSDNEDEDDGIVLNRSHKKRAKAVEYSDDEDEKPKPETQNDDDDDEDVGSEDSEELVLDEIGNEEVELDYDSEENEVIRDPKAFFDKEAELSESEWGSEDEDEKDLDKFEEEAGDQEVLDEDEVNRELGKIHMQQMLVDDKRDVRILQELLLEDGELHSEGSGRQRQFRWANADSGFVGGEPNTKDSDEEGSDNEEDEEIWRKKRHERELFLNKKNERLKELGIEEEDDEDEEEEEDGGGLLGMGRAVLKRMQTSTLKPPTNTVTSKLTSKVNVASKAAAAAVTMNCKFMAKNMRGSFLTSSDHYLSRLAHITTKVGSEGNVNGPKNSRNFVFSIVSPKKDEVKDAEPEEANKMKKRKASENAANSKKKIHFSDDKGNEKRKSLLEVLG